MFQPHLAVVLKSARGGAEYLRLESSGVPRWVRDPGSATAFASMRDAARAAVHLPSSLRAFGLPLEVELDCWREPSMH
jgi:hypothetical protein